MEGWEREASHVRTETTGNTTETTEVYKAYFNIRPKYMCDIQQEMTCWYNQKCLSFNNGIHSFRYEGDINLFWIHVLRRQIAWLILRSPWGLGKGRLWT